MSYHSVTSPRQQQHSSRLPIETALHTRLTKPSVSMRTRRRNMIIQQAIFTAYLIFLVALPIGFVAVWKGLHEMHPFYSGKSSPWTLLFCIFFTVQIGVISFAVPYFAILLTPWVLKAMNKRLSGVSPVGKVVPSIAKDLLQDTMVSLRGLRIYASLTICLFTTSLVAHYFFNPPDETLVGSRVVSLKTAKSFLFGKSTSWLDELWRSMFLIAVCLLMEKALVQRLASAFHAANFAKRVEENNWVISMLGKVKRELGVRLGSTLHEEAATTSPIATTMSPFLGRGFSNTHTPLPSDLPAPHVTVLRASGRRETLRRQSIYTGGLDRRLDPDMAFLQGDSTPSLTGSNQSTDQEIPLEDALLEEDETKNLGNALFDAMRPSLDSTYLTKADFDRILHAQIKYELTGTESQSEKLFRFFDRRQLGQISRQDWCTAVVDRVFKERDRIIASLTANSVIIARLDVVLTAFAILIGCLISFSFLRGKKWDTLAATAATIGIASIIEGTMSQLVDDMTFIFLIHPFDIGDSVQWDGTGYTVSDIGLTETVLCGPGNQLTYVKNHALTEGGAVINNSRSMNIFDTLTLPINTTTESSIIRKLELLIRDWCSAMPGEFIGSECRITSIKIISAEIMNIDFQITYRGSLGEGMNKDARWGMLISWLRSQALPQLNIELAPVNWDT